LAMPDLDQIKQGEQGCETGAGWVVDTFVRAIEISDFDRRLPLVETDCFNDSGAVTGMHDAGPGGYFDP